jgi:hypothetical protein
MRRGFASLFGAVLLASPGLAGEPTSSRSHSSPNGLWSIKLTELEPGKCRVETSKDNAPAWHLERCVGTADDHLFVSDDGQRFWVVHSFPRIPEARAAQGRPEKWLGVEVAAEYDRDGQKLQSRVLKSFMTHELEKLRDMGHRFVWLSGVGGLPGKGPRVTDAGLVELDTASDKTFRLKF